MNIAFNPLISSCSNNINSTRKYSAKGTETNFKNINSNLSANGSDLNKYLDDIKNCFPNTTVTVKSMTAGDVQKYYEQWKKEPINCSGFSHSIMVSPKVLEKMEKDPKYAEQMLLKIKKAATPEGFENMNLYEYKVIVRDDGEIETMACADAKIKKNETVDEDKKKHKKKKNELELAYFQRNLWNQGKALNILGEGMNKTQLNQQYLFNLGIEQYEKY